MIQVHPDEPRYDDRHYLVLEGRTGSLLGEQVKVCLGESVVVGRSRECELSLKKAVRYLEDRDGERGRIAESLEFRAASRRHVRVTYLGADLVEIQNLSRNGTLVDGHRVDRVVLPDARSARHEIRLGPHGDVVELRCGSVEVSLRAC